jgi:hypothetical protein
LLVTRIAGNESPLFRSADTSSRPFIPGML